MEIILLGTGTSQGIPIIACECEVCQSKDTLDKRLRTSALIKTDETTICIDAGPDFRQQMLRENVKSLNAILITHNHKDHTGGLDDIRSFNWVHKKPMDVYAREEVMESLKHDYSYAFTEVKYPGIPQISMHTIPYNDFYVNSIKITPIEAMHLNLPVVGFRIGDFTYLTDANYIDSLQIEKMKGSEIIVINALRRRKHISHFSLEETLNLIEEIKPQKAYITHISHQMGLHKEVEKELPENVFLGYDGLSIMID
jgi:phosphoribosyl 1,2-cyclic phosphate phosphodiesterase